MITSATRPGFVPAYANLGNASGFLGGRAIEYYDKAIRLNRRDPRLSGFYDDKGLIYFALHQDDRAIAQRDHDPDHRPKAGMPEEK